MSSSALSIVVWLALIRKCAVKKRGIPVGESRTRQMLLPWAATEAAGSKATSCPKPPMIGDV